MSRMLEFYIGLVFLISFSLFAGFCFTVLAARYGLIDIFPSLAFSAPNI